jgi:hypothetical protein
MPSRAHTYTISQRDSKKSASSQVRSSTDEAARKNPQHSAIGALLLQAEAALVDLAQPPSAMDLVHCPNAH